MKTTPHPWEYHNGMIYSHNGDTIATVNHTSRHITTDEADANGQLMASAPELLEACADLLQLIESEGEEFYNKYIESFNKAINAVQKATP